MGADSVIRLVTCSAALLALHSLGAFADQTADDTSAGLASQLVLEAGLNDEGGEDYYADLSLNFASGFQAFAAAGHTRSTIEAIVVGPVVFPAEEVTTDYVAVGIGSNPLDTVTGAVDAAYWGDGDAITTETLRLSLGWNAGDWSLLLAPLRRTIKFHTATLGTREIGSDGYAASIAYFGLAPLSLSVGYAANNYDRDLSPLGQLRALLWVLRGTLQRQALELAAGLEDERFSASAFYVHGPTMFGLDWFRSVSAVDDSRIYAATLSMFWDVTAQWQLRLKAGQQEADDDAPPLYYASLGFAHRW